MEKIKQVAAALKKYTTKKFETEQGTYNPYDLLDFILEMDEDNLPLPLKREPQFLIEALSFIVSEKINYEGFGIGSIWDNTINGRDYEVTSYLVCFVKKSPFSMFWIEITPGGVREWKEYE